MNVSRFHCGSCIEEICPVMISQLPYSPDMDELFSVLKNKETLKKGQSFYRHT